MIDLDLLDENLQKMQATGQGRRQGAAAARQDPQVLDARPRCRSPTARSAICAAKVSEAEALVDAGISEVLVTGPVAGSREGQPAGFAAGHGRPS
ncbi:MAG: hypothetical protein MZV63_58425 [Marinilabiliales bacterium]|nr:hypothetical protein [Marinilabiliales bacterium]